MTTGMPDNGGTWHWQGREGSCHEHSLAIECSVIGFFVNIYIPVPYLCHIHQQNVTCLSAIFALLPCKKAKSQKVKKVK